MILRRIRQHVRDQNWTAIAIYFVIVVVGVFLGIQIGNWNADRSDQAAYIRALDRLGTEIADNLDALGGQDQQFASSLQTVEEAFDALLSCTDSEANREAIDAGLSEIRGSNGLDVRLTALDEITTSPSLLDQQSAAERERFADLRYYVGLMQNLADFSEQHPLGNRIENNPILAIGGKRDISWDYQGVEFSKICRVLVLAVPVSEACRDDRLVKSFFNWEAWQTNLPVTAQIVRSQLEETQSLLNARVP